MSDLVPRSQLTGQGLKGTAAVIGGGALLVLSALSAHWLLGLIVGGVAAVAGLALAGSRSERKAGIVGLIAGGATVLASLIPGLRWLLWVPGLGLLVAGGLSLFRFGKNLRKRT